MDKVKVGVIGTGALGRHHARLYKECDNTEVVGIYDANPENLKRVADELELPAFEDLDRLVESVEALSVAVPTDLHYDVVIELLRKGKHVLVEKPITPDVEQAEKLVAEAAKRNLILQVGHVERFNPMMSYLQKKADNPRFIEAHRLASYPPPRPGMLPRGTEVGVVMDLMIHDIDLILSLTNSEVTHVDATGIAVLSKTEDIANARIKFANGCVANLTASRVSPEYMRKVRVFQSDTYFSLDYHNHTGEMYVKGDKGIGREEVPVNKHNALLKQLEDFIGSIYSTKNGSPTAPQVTGENGLEALKVAAEITRQIQEVVG